MSRMDVIAFKKGANDKTYVVRLGSAVPKKQGEGWTLYLDAIPAPENGQWVISVVPPRERQPQSNQGGGGGDPPPF